MSPKTPEQRKRQTKCKIERKLQEQEQLKSEDIEPGGSILATFHTQPDVPLSKLPRCSGPPNMKTFYGKKWFPYQQDLKDVLNRLGCWK